MKILKPFLAGMIIPSVLVPFTGTLLHFYNEKHSLFHVLVPFIPLVWGFWNILFINFEGASPIIDRKINIWLWGSFLGLILVSLASFFSLPKEILNIEGNMTYAFFLIVPIAYGIVWRYFVAYFNEALDLF